MIFIFLIYILLYANTNRVYLHISFCTTDLHHHNIIFASNVASQSDVTPKHGAIITHGGKIISTGFNKPNTTRKKLMLRYVPINLGCRIHAEYDCLYNLITSTRFSGNNSIRRKKLDIYVARDNLLNSKPCFHCIKVLKFFGIRRVYYSNKENIIYKNIKDKIKIEDIIYYVCEKINEIENSHIAHNNKYNLKHRLKYR